MIQWAFPLDQDNCGAMQQRCMKCHCIYLLALFNFNDRLLSEIISSGIRLDVDIECVNATTGYLKC